MSRHAYIDGIECVKTWRTNGTYSNIACDKAIEVLGWLRDGVRYEIDEGPRDSVELIQGEEADALYKLAGFYALGEPNENKEAYELMKAVRSDTHCVTFFLSKIQ